MTYDIQTNPFPSTKREVTNQLVAEDVTLPSGKHVNVYVDADVHPAFFDRYGLNNSEVSVTATRAHELIEGDDCGPNILDRLPIADLHEVRKHEARWELMTAEQLDEDPERFEDLIG